MATIGLSYPVYAPITSETSGGAVYGSGKEAGRAISVELSIETYDDKLYANNALAESVKGFKSGSMTFGADELEPVVYAELMGHTLENADISGETDIKAIIAKGGDEAPTVGFGFYANKQVNNKQYYRAIFLHKVKFAPPSEKMDTKGENITFQTPSLQGTIMTDQAGVWKEEVTVEKESSAIQWLNQKLNVTHDAVVEQAVVDNAVVA